MANKRIETTDDYTLVLNVFPVTELGGKQCFKAKAYIEGKQHVTDTCRGSVYIPHGRAFAGKSDVADNAVAARDLAERFGRELRDAYLAAKAELAAKVAAQASDQAACDALWPDV